MNRYVIVHHGPVPVALVACPSEYDNSACLEYAWKRTNNTEGSWSRGPMVDGVMNPDYSTEVRRLTDLHMHEGVALGLRSSMVGDEFVLDGITYVAATIGFERRD